MAYLANGPSYGLLSKQNLIPNSSTTTFTLSYTVGSASGLMVVYNGVIQEPDAAYNVINSGTQIQFTFTPLTGMPLYVIYLGNAVMQNLYTGYSVGYLNYLGTGSQTAFAMGEVPVTNSSVLVFVNGVQQRLGASYQYQISGTDVLFNSAPANNAQVDIYLLAKERVSVDTVADGVITRAKLETTLKNGLGSWMVANTNVTCVDGNWYMVDTLGAARTMSLPLSPTLGDTFKFVDYSGTFATNNCTVARNGLKINGLSEDLIMDINGGSATLIYTGVTNGWRVMV